MKLLSDTKVQVGYLLPINMFWDLIIGLSIVALALAIYTIAKKLESTQSEVKDLSSMVRVLRYNAMKDLEQGDRVERKAKK